MYLCLNISNGCAHLYVIWGFHFKGIYKCATLINHEQSLQNESKYRCLFGDKLRNQNAPNNTNVDDIQIQIQISA